MKNKLNAVTEIDRLKDLILAKRSLTSEDGQQLRLLDLRRAAIEES